MPPGQIPRTERVDRIYHRLLGIDAQEDLHLLEVAFRSRSGEDLERTGVTILTVPYLLGVLVLDATGCRIGELAVARVGDLDERRKAWLVRAKVAKTRRARWVEMPDDLYRIIVDRLPAREDRDVEAPLFPIGSDDRLRMAISRACGMQAFRHGAPTTFAIAGSACCTMRV